MLIIDLKQDKSKENKYISNTLLNLIEDSLKKEQKVILYLNKRGDYSSLICENCSFLFKCENCDSSMSIHDNNLICHICGFNKVLPKKCLSCNSEKLHKAGIGTGQIEKYLREKYKNHKIYRFDTDGVKKKKEKKEALEELNNTNIIIGTKMITTGFDIKNIGLIGIILLEQELQIPQYYTTEKIYSNLKQILGRGGRKGEKTNFVIQSYIPENILIQNLIFSNYKDFFTSTLQERKKFNYPPFSEFAILDYRNKDKVKSMKYIENIKKTLDINNPENKIEIIKSPNTFKRNNQYHSKIIIKGKDIRKFLNCIKKEVFSEQNLSIIFE